MSSFVSGASLSSLFTSVTQNLFGFQSAVARSTGGGVLALFLDGQPLKLDSGILRLEE